MKAYHRKCYVRMTAPYSHFDKQGLQIASPGIACPPKHLKQTFPGRLKRCFRQCLFVLLELHAPAMRHDPASQKLFIARENKPFVQPLFRKELLLKLPICKNAALVQRRTPRNTRKAYSTDLMVRRISAITSQKVAL
jgi:hypothetical protein